MSSLEPFNTGKMIAGGSLGGIVITLILGACYFLFGWLFNDSSDEEASTTTYTIAGAIVLGLIGLGLVGLLAFGIYSYRKTPTGIRFATNEKIMEAAARYVGLDPGKLKEALNKVKGESTGDSGINGITKLIKDLFTDIDKEIIKADNINKFSKTLRERLPDFTRYGYFSNINTNFYKSRQEIVTKETTKATNLIDENENILEHLATDIEGLDAERKTLMEEIEAKSTAFEDAKYNLSEAEIELENADEDAADKRVKKIARDKAKQELEKAESKFEKVKAEMVSDEFEQKMKKKDQLIRQFTVRIETLREKCRELRDLRDKVKTRYKSRLDQDIYERIRRINTIMESVERYGKQGKFDVESNAKRVYNYLNEKINNLDNQFSSIVEIEKYITKEQENFRKKYEKLFRVSANYRILANEIPSEINTKIFKSNIFDNVKSSYIVSYYSILEKIKRLIEDLKLGDPYSNYRIPILERDMNRASDNIKELNKQILDISNKITETKKALGIAVNGEVLNLEDTTEKAVENAEKAVKDAEKAVTDASLEGDKENARKTLKLALENLKKQKIKLSILPQQLSDLLTRLRTLDDKRNLELKKEDSAITIIEKIKKVTEDKSINLDSIRNKLISLKSIADNGFNNSIDSSIQNYSSQWIQDIQILESQIPAMTTTS